MTVTSWRSGLFPQGIHGLSWMLFRRHVPDAEVQALLTLLQARYPLAYRVLTLSGGLDGETRHTVGQIEKCLGLTQNAVAIQRLLAIGYLRLKWKERQKT